MALGLGTVGFIGGATIPQTVLSFFAPSLAAFQLAAEISYGQCRVADERERLGKIVRNELRHARLGPVPRAERHRLCTVTRNIQDGIHRTRLDVARVPEWLYRLNHDADLRDFGHTAASHRRRLAAPSALSP